MDNVNQSDQNMDVSDAEVCFYLGQCSSDDKKNLKDVTPRPPGLLDRLRKDPRGWQFIETQKTLSTMTDSDDMPTVTIDPPEGIIQPTPLKPSSHIDELLQLNRCELCATSSPTINKDEKSGDDEWWCNYNIEVEMSLLSINEIDPDTKEFQEHPENMQITTQDNAMNTQKRKRANSCPPEMQMKRQRKSSESKDENGQLDADFH